MGCSINCLTLIQYTWGTRGIKAGNSNQQRQIFDLFCMADVFGGRVEINRKNREREPARREGAKNMTLTVILFPRRLHARWRTTINNNIFPEAASQGHYL